MKEQIEINREIDQILIDHINIRHGSAGKGEWTPIVWGKPEASEALKALFTQHLASLQQENQSLKQEVEAKDKELVFVKSLVQEVSRFTKSYMPDSACYRLAHNLEVLGEQFFKQQAQPAEGKEGEGC